MLLQNKVSIITGGAKGIGKAIAEVFAKEGSTVVIADIDKDEALKTAEEIKNSVKVKTLALRVDVSNKKSVDSMIKKTIDEFGQIDILVNNAGTQKPTPFLDFTEELWDRIIDINLKGTFLCSQAAAKEMVKRKYGKIINISSCSAKHPNPGETAYGASKAGMLALTRDNAFELGIHGINVNAILPGITDTELTRRQILNKETEPIWIERTALKKIGKPEDQAKVALFLASNLSDHITGEGIIVSAGEVMGQ
ncbi:MAG: SDR family oxidoreductase [Actinobacteria bacterium]|nr:SDR family oxidoreductase [Actinomycetota bacterium]